MASNRAFLSLASISPFVRGTAEWARLSGPFIVQSVLSFVVCSAARPFSSHLKRGPEAADARPNVHPGPSEQRELTKPRLECTNGTHPEMGIRDRGEL